MADDLSITVISNTDGPAWPIYRAITEDIDLTDFVADAVNSLKICFAAVESYETGKVVHLK